MTRIDSLHSSSGLCLAALALALAVPACEPIEGQDSADQDDGEDTDERTGELALAGGDEVASAVQNGEELADGDLPLGNPIPAPTQVTEAITIDAGTVVRSTATRPVGINLNYLVDDEASRPAGSPRTLSQALGDMKGRFLRFPGGEKSDNYVWTTVSSTNGALVTPSTAIPTPLAPRVANPPQWPGAGSYADTTTGIFTGPNMDFDEFMAVCQANGAEPVIVVAYDQAREITGLTTGPTLAELIASAAAWVKYANVTKGYNIRYWSIGNESWFRDGLTAATYAAHVNQFAAAMRQVDPTIKIGAHGNSTAWFNTVVAAAASSIDWLDVHDYPTYNWATGYDVFRTTNPTLTADVDKALNAIAAAPVPADKARLKVGVTETNTIDWAKNGPNYTWPHVNDLGHALVTFDMLGQQLSKPKVEFTQLWNTRWINNVSFNPGTSTNAVVNPDFENDLTSWLGSGGVITTSPIYSGGKALRGNSGAYVYQDISLGAGSVRTLTAYAQTSTANVWSGIGVDFLNASGTKIGAVQTRITSANYAKYTLPPFTTPAGTTTARLWFYVGNGGTSFLDNLGLTDRAEPEVYDALAPNNTYLPAGRVLALWGQFLRDNLVQGSRSNSVIAYASRSTTDDSLSVWLLNKQTAPVDVNLALNNYTPAAYASAWRFAGNGPSDFAPTYTSLPAVSVPGNVLPITLPQTSITVLVFSPNSVTFNTTIAELSAKHGGCTQSDITTTPGWSIACMSAAHRLCNERGFGGGNLSESTLPSLGLECFKATWRVFDISALKSFHGGCSAESGAFILHPGAQTPEYTRACVAAASRACKSLGHAGGLLQEVAFPNFGLACTNSGNFLLAPFSGVSEWSDLAACDINQWLGNPQYNKACSAYASRRCIAAGHGGGWVTEVNGPNAKYGLSCFGK